MGLKNLVKRVMSDKNNIRYETELETRRISYSDWIADFEKANPPVAGPKEKRAQGERKEQPEQEELYLIFRNPGGRLSEDAKLWIQQWFEQFPEALILYGDEDVWPEGEGRQKPCFKPGWSPDLLDTRFYLGNMVAVRKTWFEYQARDTWENDIDLPGEPERDEIVAYHSFIRHCVRLAGGYEKGQGRKTILHIPRILFHCESEENRERWMRYESGERQERSENSPARRLSIVIPSKDNPDLLEKCIYSIMNTTHDMQYEIVVVDNGSTPENRAQIEAKLRGIRQSGAKGLTLVLYHYDPTDFSFSKMRNLGARKASGELLLFLSDGVEFSAEGSLRDMAQLAVRPYTGAVGLKLLYPDGEILRQIHHVGITNLPMSPVHKLQFYPDGEEYYLSRNRGRHNVLAVTAACLMVGKEKFQEAGGFCEEPEMRFADVDLCFRLYEQGYENVCECDVSACYREPQGRGDDGASGNSEMFRGNPCGNAFQTERAKLYMRHPALDAAKRTEGTDPYYSVFLNHEGLDTSIRPFYETAGNKVQQVVAGDPERVTEKESRSMKEDEGLKVCVESVLEAGGDEGGIRITGWGVLLDHNNACYDKYLVFQGEQCYRILLREQYRPDLAENMPDQEKVALNGYDILLAKDALPAGEYRVGMVAASRINSVKWLNWSDQTIVIADREQDISNIEERSEFADQECGETVD